MICLTFVLKNAWVYADNAFKKLDVLIKDGIIVEISPSCTGNSVFDFNNCYIFPGFADVHVHLREPGFSYKETILTGTKACAAGGYTHVLTMPNLNPVPDSYENLKVQLDIIRRDACISVLPFASITKGEKGEELSDFEGLAPYCAGFSDDGRGVQSEQIMLEAMKRAKKLGKIISAHCEDNSLLFGGYIHDGLYAREHGHKGISSESEWRQIERDIALAEKTGCKYHVCHISCRESVELIRSAKSRGVDITCETAPHYLVLNDSQLEEDGRFKMNPPIRSESDRLALIKGIKDGTLDMIATDHAPHSAEEKSKGLSGSLMGISGIETAFPILYTELVRKNVITLEKLIELLNINPLRRFGAGGELKTGKPANLTVFNLDERYKINSSEFLSMGKATPFDGREVFGRCLLTAADGNIVWRYNK